MIDEYWYLPVNNAQEADYNKVIDEVCAAYSITTDEIKSSCRKRPLVIARHIAMARMYYELEMTYEHIARVFSKAEHTAVIHAVKRSPWTKHITEEHEKE